MMTTTTENLTGTSLIFTDIHIGINQDKPSRQNIARNIVDEIIGHIEREHVKQVFFLGDLFHQRVAIEVSTLNLANELVRKLAKYAKVFLIQGNHDLYERYSNSVSSLSIFDIPNVEVVSVPKKVMLNGHSVLLVPWLSETTLTSNLTAGGLRDEKFDIVMGHFDVSAQAQIEHFAKRYMNLFKAREDKSDLLDTSNMNIVEELIHYTTPFATIYLGHIHEHSEVAISGRIFNIVGSPQAQVHDNKKLPDEKKRHGYYLLDQFNKERFVDTLAAPKFVTIFASDFLQGSVDQNKLKGSVVRRCYDCILPTEKKQELEALITNAKIYEEDPSTFALGVVVSSEDGEEDSTDLDYSRIIASDKMQYIKDMVDAVEDENIDKTKLLALMQDIYQKASNG